MIYWTNLCWRNKRYISIIGSKKIIKTPIIRDKKINNKKKKKINK